MSRKLYLGDGVYAEVEEGGDVVVLTTENGISVTNRIALEPETVNMLLAFLRMVGKAGESRN